MKGKKIELKPCPFCGSRKLSAQNDSYICRIVCNNCGAKGPGYIFDGNKALDAWNRRIIDE